MATSPTQQLAKINSRIAKLQAQAEAVRRKEISAVIAKIRVAIEHYGLTAEDLDLSGSRSGRKPSLSPKASTKGAQPRGSKAAAKRGRGVIRYRDDQGNAWTGQGRCPNWYVAALAAEKTPEDLSIR